MSPTSLCEVVLLKSCFEQLRRLIFFRTRRTTTWIYYCKLADKAFSLSNSTFLKIVLPFTLNNKDITKNVKYILTFVEGNKWAQSWDSRLQNVDLVQRHLGSSKIEVFWKSVLNCIHKKARLYILTKAMFPNVSSCTIYRFISYFGIGVSHCHLLT